MLITLTQSWHIVCQDGITTPYPMHKYNSTAWQLKVKHICELQLHWLMRTNGQSVQRWSLTLRRWFSVQGQGQMNFLVVPCRKGTSKTRAARNPRLKRWVWERNLRNIPTARCNYSPGKRRLWMIRRTRRWGLQFVFKGLMQIHLEVRERGAAGKATAHHTTAASPGMKSACPREPAWPKQRQWNVSHLKGSQPKLILIYWHISYDLLKN